MLLTTPGSFLISRARSMRAWIIGRLAEARNVEPAELLRLPAGGDKVSSKPASGTTGHRR